MSYTVTHQIYDTKFNYELYVYGDFTISCFQSLIHTKYIVTMLSLMRL